MKRTILVSLILLIITGFAYAEETIVFTGMPKIKISEGGASRIPETLSKIVRRLQESAPVPDIGANAPMPVNQNVGRK